MEPLNQAIQGVLRATSFINGPDVTALEAELCKYLGTPQAVACNSGTDAIVIALRALGVGEGDEVITTPFTFFATAEGISAVGAKPVFVDIDPVTFNIDPNLIEAAITPRTKVIMPVHLYGQMADMGAILAIAEKHGLKVVEDVAQAFGAEFEGRKAGTMGDAGAYSFFPSKNLGCYGDGGLITAKNSDVAETCQMLRSHGSKKKYHNEMIGYNSRLDTIQAAILRVKLPGLDAANEGRRVAAMRYGEMLGGLGGITLPVEVAGRKHVFHQYTIRVNASSLRGSHGPLRDTLQKHLEADGIGTMVYYPVPMHRLPVYQARNEFFPVAEKAATESLSLPIWPTITADKQQRVADSIKRFFAIKD